MQRDMKLFKNSFPLSLFALLLLATLLRWAISSPSSAIRLSDLFFVHGALLLTLGLLVYITSTSRLHYYRHLRKKLVEKSADDKEFEEKEKERNRLGKKGAIIAVMGGVAFLLSAITLLFQPKVF